MKANDAISGALFILLAGAIFYFTQDFRVMPGQNYGAAFFPRVIASAMALLGLVLVVQGVRARGTAPWVAFDDWTRSPRHVANVLLVIAVLVFYILASDWLGFLITGFISLFVLLLWLRGPAHWLSSLAISVLCIAGLQYFFGEVLRVPLPWGLVPPVSLRLW